MNKQPIAAFLLPVAKYLFIPIASIILFLLSYPPLSNLYGGIYSWDHGAINFMPLELFLVTIFYYSLFIILKDNRYRHFIALMPIILIYIFYEYYFISFGKIFKFCDLSEIPELIDVLPFWQIMLYVTILLHVFFIIAINITKIGYYYLLPIITIIVIVVFVSTKPVWYIDGLFRTWARFGVTYWSDQGTAQNGYITVLLYFEAEMVNSKDIASKIYDINAKDYKASQDKLVNFLKEKNNRRNVHVIIMESFFNPQLFAKIDYNDTVYAKNFSSLIAKNESTVISPVFGGFTAEAEFEVLCGAPALHKYDSIEFNGFTGANVFCIPTTLKEAGYRVVATNSYKPSFFNEINAYKGLGFGEIYFPKQYTPKSNTYLSLVDKSDFIFDGDLFEQNLAFVKAHLEQKEHPAIFNYVLGVYGHLPFNIDKKRHPIRLKAQVNKKPLNDEYQRATNQIYYRTQALADYLQKLIKLDPNSLIIIMGDHVPKLGGMKFYKDMGYRNNEKDSIHKPPAFFIINSQFIEKHDLHQYDMINVMYDYITDNQYCLSYPCQRTQKTLEYQYDMDMARALR